MVEPSTHDRPRAGVVFWPTGSDGGVEVAGLDAALRHCLALQAAGAQSVHFVGDAPELPRDPRLTIPLGDAMPSTDAEWLLVRGDFTYHRTLPARLMTQFSGGVVGVAGSRVEGDAIFVCAGEDGEAVVTALESGEGPKDCERLAALEGEFVLAAGSPDEARASLAAHLRSLIKPTGGVLDRHLMRPVSLQITRWLLPTSVTPNAVTWLSLILALVAAGLIAFDDPRLYIGGAILHFFVRIVDCVDGELARLRYQGSDFGQFLDTISDGIGVAALVAAVTYRARELHPQALLLGLGGVVLYLCVQVLQLMVARRATGGGSLQAVEWSFLQKEATGVDRLVGAIHAFVRIDFISTLYAVLVAANQLVLLLVLHGLASLGGTLYLMSQLPRKLGARAG